MRNHAFPILPAVSTIILATSAVAQCPSLTLAPGGPDNFQCSPTSCTLTPLAGRWNVVAITSQSVSWSLSLPGVATSNPLASGAEYSVANGGLGTVSAGPAVVSSLGAAAYRCVVQLAAASTMSVNVPLATTFPASHVVRIFEFSVLAPGLHTISVGGNVSSLHWDLFAPGTSAAWRARDSSLGGGAMGSGQSISLGAGVHALVVVRESATLPVSFPLNVSVTCGPSAITLSPGTQVTVSAPCRQFLANPVAGRFNVAGVASDANWNLAAGALVSANPGTISDFAIGDGRSAALPALAGTFSAAAGSATGAALHVGAPATLPVQATNVRIWSGTRAFEVLEFQAPAAADYRFTTTGPSSLGFGLHGPSASGAWRARNDSEVFHAQMNGGPTVRSLAAGWHALVVTDDAGGPGGSTFPLPTPQTYSIQIVEVPPVVTSVASGLILAGGPGVTITVNGDHFSTASTAEWNLSPVPTSFVSTTQLQATIAAGLVPQPGAAAVRVRNSLFGVSNSVSVDVVGPRIDSITPAVVPNFNYVLPIRVFGGNFLPGTVLHLNGAPRLTTPVSSTELQCFLFGVPQANIPGGIAVTAVNFGTVASNTVALPVFGGSNRGTILRNPLQPAPGSAFGYRVEGGVPGQPLSLLISAGETQPLTGWPLPVFDFVLGIDLATMVPVADGMGLFGPPTGAAFTLVPGATAPSGVFEIGGFVLPLVPMGIDLSLQGIHLDPSSPVGFRLTWARYPDSF